MAARLDALRAEMDKPGIRTDNELMALARSEGVGAMLRHEKEQARQRKLVAEADAPVSIRLQSNPKSRYGTLNWLEISQIEVHTGRRPINHKVVADLAQNIRAKGLLYPLIVREQPDDKVQEGAPGWILVAGAHRLAAIASLGAFHAPVVVLDVDVIEAEIIEIAENLHRSELSALERDEQVARWIELTAVREEVSPQPEAKPKGGRPEGGIRAAARELGLEKEDARRATKVASLSDEAKQVARDVGLDDNRTALLSAAKEAEPVKQAAKLREWDAAREVEAAKRSLAKKQAAIVSSVDAGLEAFLSDWENLSLDVRPEALVQIGAVAAFAFEEAMERADAAEREKQATTKEIERLKKDLEKAKANLEDANGQVLAMKAEASVAVRQRNDAQAKLMYAQSDAERLAAELAAAQEEMGRLKDDDIPAFLRRSA